MTVPAKTIHPSHRSSGDPALNGRLPSRRAGTLDGLKAEQNPVLSRFRGARNEGEIDKILADVILDSEGRPDTWAALARQLKGARNWAISAGRPDIKMACSKAMVRMYYRSDGTNADLPFFKECLIHLMSQPSAMAQYAGGSDSNPLFFKPGMAVGIAQRQPGLMKDYKFFKKLMEVMMQGAVNGNGISYKYSHAVASLSHMYSAYYRRMLREEKNVDEKLIRTKYGIEFLERYPPGILAHMAEPRDYSRPLCVMIYGKYDPDKAFRYHWPELSKLQKSFDVRIYEATGEQDVERILKTCRNEFGPIKGLFLAGHSKPGKMLFGYVHDNKHEEDYLSISDRDSFKRMRQYIGEDTFVGLMACSSSASLPDGSPGLAQTMSKDLGCRVEGALAAANVFDIDIRKGAKGPFIRGLLFSPPIGRGTVRAKPSLSGAFQCGKRIR